MLRLLAVAAILTLSAIGPGRAQTNFPTPNPSYPAQGVVLMCINSSGQAVPATAAGTCLGSSGSGGGTVGQGAAGAAPWPVFAGQYNATLPTLTSGAPAYVALDSSGRLIQAPGASVVVSNFPATQPVTNAGTFAVQDTVPIIGGNATAVKVDGSAVTQPVSNASLPLPAGAATAANQANTAPGTSAASAQGVQGVTGGVPVPMASIATTAAGGVASFSRISSSAATTNATVAKASTGRVYKIFACNTSTTAAFLRFYNTATAPTVGTTTVLFSRPIPPAASAGGLACSSYDVSDIGWSFSTGISYALTGGNADNDTTALTAGQVTQISVEYQ